MGELILLLRWREHNRRAWRVRAGWRPASSALVPAAIESCQLGTAAQWRLPRTTVPPRQPGAPSRGTPQEAAPTLVRSRRLSSSGRARRRPRETGWVRPFDRVLLHRRGRARADLVAPSDSD